MPCIAGGKASENAGVEPRWILITPVRYLNGIPPISAFIV
jgi:hypothetical protein